MRDLSNTIRNIFSNISYSNNYRDTRTPAGSIEKYIEIGVSPRVFEVPLFAFSHFVNLLPNTFAADILVARLGAEGARMRFKSVDREMIDALAEPYKYNTFTCIPVEQEGITKYYRCTKGAIFNPDYNPIMCCSWAMERVDHDSFQLVRPILRISPECFANPSNAVEKFVVNKFAKKALSLSDESLSTIQYMINYNYHNLDISSINCKIKVVIDDFPFNVRKVDAPSINTTNEILIQTALDNIDEFTK